MKPKEIREIFNKIIKEHKEVIKESFNFFTKEHQDKLQRVKEDCEFKHNI